MATTRHEVTLDRLTRGILAALTVLLTVIAVELWAWLPSTTPTAAAQGPDSGAQRTELIAEARRTNLLLEEILDHLRTKTIKVRMGDTDKSDERRDKATTREDGRRSPG